MKINYLFFLLLPFVTFGQEVKYRLLDSNLDVIKVKNRYKLSSKERKNVYHYAEYLFENQSLIKIKYYYAKGKYPTYNKTNWSEIVNKKGSISFSNINKAVGILRSYVDLKAVKVNLDTILNSNDLLKYFKSIEKFYPNGKKMFDLNFDNGKKEGSQIVFNNLGEIIYNISWKEDIVSKRINYIKDSYGVFEPNDKNWKSYSVTQYDKRTDRKKAKWYYNNGKEIINKREVYSILGRQIYSEVDNINEISLKQYFKKNNTPIVEGVYTVKNTSANLNYKIALLEGGDDKFYGYQLGGFMYNVENWKKGEIRTIFEKTLVPNYYNITWLNDYKKQEISQIIELKSGAIASFGKYTMIKLYPGLNSINKVKPKSDNDWAGNGSGIIISKSGHIITNHHVIKDAEKIEVEFMLDNELQKLNAEVIQIDKTNDLAVLKIFDRNFDGVNEPPYNFKFRSSDVGTKVYAFGYPMALSIMGKEIKVTDGMISSKSGFDGNITTYQITAPIQGGNSGGPLFDEQANLIGINSSGLKKDIADNVAYSIKTSYVSNLLDVLPKSIELPSSTRLKSLPLTKQIKEISKYVVLIKVK
jgi:S1-C subfamily serine protease